MFPLFTISECVLYTCIRPIHGRPHITIALNVVSDFLAAARRINGLQSDSLDYHQSINRTRLWSRETKLGQAAITGSKWRNQDGLTAQLNPISWPLLYVCHRHWSNIDTVFGCCVTRARNSTDSPPNHTTQPFTLSAISICKHLTVSRLTKLELNGDKKSRATGVFSQLGQAPFRLLRRAFLVNKCHDMDLLFCAGSVQLQSATMIMQTSNR